MSKFVKNSFTELAVMSLCRMFLSVMLGACLQIHEGGSEGK
jgi:hypothetical protein